MNDQVKVGDKIVVVTDVYAEDGCLRSAELTVVRLTDGGVWAAFISGDMVLEFCLKQGEYRKVNTDKPVVAEKILQNGEYGVATIKMTEVDGKLDFAVESLKVSHLPPLRWMCPAKLRNAKPGAPAVLHDARVVRDGEQIGGGFFVFRRGSKTGRVRTPEWPFEHPTLEAAQAEAARLTAKHAGETFEVFGREDK